MAANVTFICNLAANASGFSQNKLFLAASIGCILGANDASGDAEEICGREAIDGIIENCLG